jgi:hypothetical protein
MPSSMVGALAGGSGAASIFFFYSKPYPEIDRFSITVYNSTLQILKRRNFDCRQNPSAASF